MFLIEGSLLKNISRVKFSVPGIKLSYYTIFRAKRKGITPRRSRDTPPSDGLFEKPRTKILLAFFRLDCHDREPTTMTALVCVSNKVHGISVGSEDIRRWIFSCFSRFSPLQFITGFKSVRAFACHMTLLYLLNSFHDRPPKKLYCPHSSILLQRVRQLSIIVVNYYRLKVVR